ncbi:uncharacterized protein LOC107271364 [Cephus cinctus]|uniref:Uncharacterized protein LOC107271364 n=1 Tax=Cephus cinctus TaxID=211228 RepID=A0AAJ7FQ41_CEPCN|nr:uncharacterized protein LOC107271364 [Cephus cinctus]
MNFDICNVSDEFEPRITPRPAPRFDCVTTPSVPEVSLVFEKPAENAFTLSESDTPRSPNIDKYESYAAWKQKKYTDTYNSGRIEHSRSQSQANHLHKTVLTNESLKHSHSDPSLSSRIAAAQNFNKSGDLHTIQEVKKISPIVHQRQKGFSSNPCPDTGYQPYQYEVHGVLGTPTDARSLQQTIKRSEDPYDRHHYHSVPRHSNRNSYGDSYRQKYPRSENPSSFHSIPHTPYRPSQQGSCSPKISGHEYQNGIYARHAYPPYFDPEHLYPFPIPYPPGYQSPKPENEDTVKNLLQLVNNQSEQIKSLQSQVERLLKIQEKNMKERGKCSCLHESSRQSSQVCVRSYDEAVAVNNSSNAIQSPKERERPSRTIERNLVQSTSKIQEIESTPLDGDDAAKNGQDPRNAILEQKVSIGVMTSFEFTVQNSPFEQIEHDAYRPNGNLSNDILRKSSSSTAEVLRKSQNNFSRSNAPLENIIEDSESHLSSSRQPSSNFHITPSTDDSPEKHNQLDSIRQDFLRGNDAYRREVEKQHHLENQSQRALHGLKEELKRREILGKSPEPGKDFRNDSRNQSPYNHPSEPSRENVIPEHDRITQNPQFQSRSPLTVNHVAPVENEKKKIPGEESLVLSSGELEVRERPPPSPEPSIHVEMQEYSSDEESEKEPKRTPKVGWTFYNNVLGQVNQILQNSPVAEIPDQKESKKSKRTEENKVLMDSIKVATMEQLRKLGISFVDNSDLQEVPENKKVTFDSSYYPRLDYRANLAQATSAISETDTSMQMKALALKYLSDEQLADLALQKQAPGTLKHLLLSNVQGTNMSFATMRYLERYQLLQGKNGDTGKENVEVPQEPRYNTPSRSPKPRRYPPLTQTPRTSYPSKILDISTLKQQPKLL